MALRDIFPYINAKNFFENYATDVKNYKHKLRGFSGKGKEITFTKEDERHIKKGLRDLTRDLKNFF